MAPEREQEIRDLRSRFWSERDPDGRAFVPLADAFRRAGGLREALLLLDDGLARHPSFVSGHVVSAWVHRDAGDAESAEGAFRQALELDPENARALHGLGQLLARAGRLAAGRELVLRAVELDPHLEWEEGTAHAGGQPYPEVEGGPGTAAAEEPVESEDDLWATVVGAEEVVGHDDEADVVDIRSLAPRAVGGVLGDDGRGAILEIEALAPSASADEAREEEADRTPAEWDAVWAEAPADGPGKEGAPSPVVSDEPESEIVPASGGSDEPVGERAISAPDEPVIDIAELAPAPSNLDTGAGEEEDDESEVEDLLYTRTMADLLARQGLRDKALEVVRHLRRRDPDDEELAERERELEGRSPPIAPAASLPDAWPLASPAGGVEAPLDRDPGAKGEDLAGPAEDAAPGAEPESIEAYLQGLLAWPSRRSSGGAEQPDEQTDHPRP